METTIKNNNEEGDANSIKKKEGNVEGRGDKTPIGKTIQVNPFISSARLEHTPPKGNGGKENQKQQEKGPGWNQTQSGRD